MYTGKKSSSWTEVNQREEEPQILSHQHHQLHSSVGKQISTGGRKRGHYARNVFFYEKNSLVLSNGNIQTPPKAGQMLVAAN